ncbi:MAG: NAD(P)H-dependent oxidoreductase subunit E [Anaerolineales bacterium]|nr:NAD(P)H-dependent oxidoreductase subunit E [Anaerolineales bacterium]
MNRVELQALAEKETERQQQFRCRLLCCSSTPCVSSGALPVQEIFQQAIKNNQLTKEVQVVPTGCMGPCSQGPLVKVQTHDQPDVLYEGVTPAVAEKIVAKHILQDGAEDSVTERHALSEQIPFFTRQVKIVLANSGLIDPERFEEYVMRGGYHALAHALREMTPEQICDEITRSGLRGRGGAGYPAGLKWGLVRKSPGAKKFVVANGDEGDPGAYMDRTIMESDPHRVLEGMAIAGYAVGAEQGYVYVRGEYPEAIKRLEKAIRTAERRGVLGSRVLDSNFSFRVDIRIGAGAFVCGEETALMASIMGRRGQPVPRPPYPSESGLWGYPTLINNVETFANIAPIITRGAPWYASIGTEKSKGSKVFALAGNLNTTGLIEVPMGILLRDIVYDIGGGIPDGRTFKAAQTGGPSGGYLPATHLDTPVDFESLKALGSIMGSGGLVILDDKNSMPDMAKFFMEFCMDESCGKCLPCRVGTVQMYRILDRFTSGTATPADLKKLEELCVMVKETSLCGLGQSAPNPVLSTLRYFREEYEAQINERAARLALAENGGGQ